MAYQITSVTTKANISDPDFYVWYETILDPNVVYNKFPNLTGQSISSIVKDEIDKLYDPTKGFISEEVSESDDNSVFTLVTTYEHQSNVIPDISNIQTESCSGNILFTKDSASVTGANTYFTSELEIGDKLVAKLQRANGFIYIGDVASIESDTSLTLAAEAKVPLDWDNKMDEWGLPRDYMVNTSYVKVLENQTPLSFIQDLYHATYSVTKEITYANV
jgi:hypothetical protein